MTADAPRRTTVSPSSHATNIVEMITNTDYAGRGIIGFMVPNDGFVAIVPERRDNVSAWERVYCLGGIVYPIALRAWDSDPSDVTTVFGLTR